LARRAGAIFTVEAVADDVREYVIETAKLFG
jgi:hypothetical protein